MIEFTDTTLTEPLKTFETPDALGKAYLELHGRASSGDISLLPEDIRKDPTLANFKNVTDVAKSFIETKKLVGTIKHAPAKAEEYKFTELKDLHPGVAKGVAGTRQFLAGQFHALDIDNERADKMQQAILTGLHNAMVAQDKANAEKSKEVETKLRSDWGGDYDKNKSNVDLSLKKMGMNKLAAMAQGDVEVLKEVHKLTSVLSEDTIGKLGEGSQSSIDTSTKEGAKKALDEMMAGIVKQGKSHPFYDEKHADHQKILDKYNELTTKAFG
jgi:hypothetical protein